jgi:hypothetical protein
MKNLIFLFLLVVVLACQKEDSISELNELLDFNVEAIDGFIPVHTHIDSASAQVHVFCSTLLNMADFPIVLTPELTVSTGATVNPSSGTAVTFDDPEDFVKYTITSQDGQNSKEYIFTIRDMQIPNADFENWFNEIGMNSQPFPQPGKYGESTVWATTNMGTSIYSIYGTSPMQDGDNTLIKIETVATVALPIVAGALYLGEFDLDGAIADPTNPVAAAKLGIPFYGRPSALHFKYSFQAGDQMIQAVLKDPGNLFGGFDIFELDGSDKFGIEVVLEKRVGDEITTVAKANFESDQNTIDLTEYTLPLQYLSEEEPTHFYVSFSPSFDGGTFKGAIGSTLIIDDLQLMYE